MRINVTRSSLPPFEDYCEEIRSLWDSHWLTNNGQKLLAFEDALKARLQSPHVALFVNGHLALEAVLGALHLKGEVVTTPFTFASTTHAIVRKGLTSVFCDIKPDDYTLDPALLEQHITKNTCAILPVHVYGSLCDVEAIEAVAKKHGLPVIYDAAHAFGVTKNGVDAATFGDAAMFSFHATKVFHSIEGGAVATKHDDLMTALELERNYGITGPEDVVSVGGNAKMNEFQAAMGLCNLRGLDGDIAARKRVHEQYTALLSGVAGVRLPAVQAGVTSNYAYYPVVFEGGREVRDAVCDALKEKGVYARKYFYPLTCDFECYQGLAGFADAHVPVARRIAQSVVTLPLYPDLAAEDVQLIAHTILETVGA